MFLFITGQKLFSTVFERHKNFSLKDPTEYQGNSLRVVIEMTVKKTNRNNIFPQTYNSNAIEESERTDLVRLLRYNCFLM